MYNLHASQASSVPLVAPEGKELLLEASHKCEEGH